jgi:hypothetical protein
VAITEEPAKGPPILATSREPVAPKDKSGKANSVGAQALQDAIIMVVVAWLVLFFLAWTLRAHNV